MALKRIGLSAIAIGTGLIGILQVKDTLPEWLKDYLTPVLFQGTTVLGIAILLLGLFALAISFLGTRLEHQTIRGFHHSAASLSDLDAIRSLATKLFDTEDVSPLAQMREWLRKHKRTFVVVFTRSKTGLRTVQEIQGYFCVIPLVESAALRIKTGEITAMGLSSNDIAGDRASAIYLGGIAARGNIARGVCLGQLQEELARIFRVCGDVEVLTRPVTSDGLRLAKGYGFRPLTGKVLRLGELATIQLSEICDEKSPSA